MEAQIQQDHSTTGARQFQQDAHSSSQPRTLQDHAGHGQRITLHQAQYALQFHNPQQHPNSPGTVPSAASTPAASVGLPLYRDQAGQIQLASDSNANQIKLYSQGTPSNSQATARRPSVTQHTKRNKSSRNHPYILRQPSNSVSSVASNSSSHSHHSSTSSLHSVHNENTAAVFYSNTTSNHSYPNLGVAPSSSANNSANHFITGPRNVSATSQPTWPPDNYVHSRSSSVSSVSSDFSASSHESSSWSDSYDHNDTSNTSQGYVPNPCYAGNGSNANASSAGFHGSPAIQASGGGGGRPFQQRTASTDSHGSASLSLANQRTDTSHQYHKNQIQLRNMQVSSSSSTGSMYPVLLQPAHGSNASSSSSSQHSSPVDSMGSNSSFGRTHSGHVDNAYGNSTLPNTPADLTGLAEAIRKSAGSTNTTEKARVNFVHGWLRQSFTLHPEGNISRHALYNAYIHICHQYNIAPINAASYGKAVRSCWPGIKTRRLGVRGASRYHYCGIRAANETMRQIVDYYNGFEDESGKPISCVLPAGTNNDSNGGGQWSSDDDQGDVSSQEGLVAHMGGLNGLGVSGPDNGSNNSSYNGSHHGFFDMSGFSATPPLPQSLFHAKIERPGSAFSAIERPPSVFSDGGIRFSIDDGAISAETSGPALDGPFVGGGSPGEQFQEVQRQSAEPPSLHDQAVTSEQFGQTQASDNFEFNFGEMKTPTAFHFLQSNQHILQQASVYASGASTSTNSSSNASNGSATPDVSVSGNGSRLAVPNIFGVMQSMRDSQTSTEDTRVQEQASSANITEQLALRRTSSPATSAGRSASIPNASTASDSFALRFKGRRATLPDLHITIPPLARNPPSGRPGSSLSRSSDVGSLSIREEREETMHDTAHDNGDGDYEDDQMEDGKKTARLPSRNTSQQVQTASIFATPDLSLPSFQEIVQSFSTRLVGSPNHPAGRTSSASPESRPAGTEVAANSSTLSADDVIAARNNSMALLKTLDMAHADVIWDLYRTSHCRGLLRLVRQGRLEEFEGAFLLFWSQLDSSQQELVQHPVLRDAMYQADSLMYPCLLAHLCERLLFNKAAQGFQDGLAPPPVDLVQPKHVATNMEEWAVTAFDSYPAEFADCRVELASRTAHLLGRLVGVAQLGNALSQILEQPTSVLELINAWDTLDFDMIFNQTALVTGCSQEAIQAYFDAFATVLKTVSTASQTASLDHSETLMQLTQFADEALQRYLTQIVDLNAQLLGVQEQEKNRPPSAFALKLEERPFLLKWSYLTGQILRDLTISNSPAFGSYQILSLFLEEYLAFKILKNTTLRSDNIAASIQLDNEGSTNGQSPVPAYYINTGTGSNTFSTSALMDTFKEQENAAMAFLVSPQASTHAAAKHARHVNAQDRAAVGPARGSGGSQEENISNSCSASSKGFTIPPGQPSASAFTASFNLSSTSSTSANTIWSPATRYLFSELALPSATSTSFTLASGSQVDSADKTDASESSSLAILPPPTPSAFSSFPNLRSPGLSRYFPSSSHE